MHDIKPLEREWKKYRRKKLKPWLIASVTFILAAVLAIVFLDSTKLDFSTFDTSFMMADNTSSGEEKKVYHHTVKSNVLVNTALTTLETEKNVIDQVKDTANDSENTFVDIPILDGRHENSVGTRQKGRAKVHLDIMESSSITAYKDVEKRFAKSHDIDDSLFLARSYYKKGNYKKSEHWALETNKVDANVEESIFIFVKSKVKMGRKNEAVSILKSYLKKSNSQEAVNLLHRIENNKI